MGDLSAQTRWLDATGQAELADGQPDATDNHLRLWSMNGAVPPNAATSRPIAIVFALYADLNTVSRCHRRKSGFGRSARRSGSVMTSPALA